jgi:hypothetical protein
MAFVMEKEREVVDECVEEIRPRKGRDIDADVSVSCVITLMQMSTNVRKYSACVDGSGTRYWKLICSLMEVIEEIKSPLTIAGGVSG